MTILETSLGPIGISDVGAAPDGAAGKAPVLFLHGVGSDKGVWRPQLDHFERRGGRRAIAIDYPGYGESAPRPGATRDDFAAAVEAVMDRLDLADAHVCGLSLGGVVAIALAHRAPSRIRSLVLADSFAVHPDGQGIHDRSVGAASSIGLRALAEGRVDALLAPGASDPLRREVIETMAAIDPTAYALGAAAVWLADQRDRAAAIRTPTLVLCGEADGITPPALSRELAALIPGAQLALIAGAGHLANAERPGDFNRLVEGFISAFD